MNIRWVSYTIICKCSWSWLFVIFDKILKIYFGIFLFASLLVGGILTQFIKHVVGRPRPNYTSLEENIGFDFFKLNSEFHSFPSGHASTIFVVAVTIIFFLPKMINLTFPLISSISSTLKLNNLEIFLIWEKLNFPLVFNKVSILKASFLRLKLSVLFEISISYIIPFCIVALNRFSVSWFNDLQYVDHSYFD